MIERLIFSRACTFFDEFLHFGTIANAANIDSAYTQRLVLQTMVIRKKCL